MTTNQTPNTMASSTAVKRTPLPDFADIIFLLIIMLLVNLLPNFVLGDGSTGWHLYTGKYILSHGQIPHTDLFSYTFPTKNWVPYEWLFDAVAAGLLSIGGIKLVAIVTDCALAGLFSLIYYDCRKAGCHFLLSMLFVVLGILTSTIHWLARPHLFTFFGVFIFAHTLEAYRRGNASAKRLLCTLTLTMVVWANSHPAFLIGFGILGIYLVCETFIWMMSGEEPTRSQALTRVKTLALAAPLTFVASLLNANGIQLYSYIFDYLHHSQVLAATNEYMPPNFKQLHAVCLALLFFAFVVGLLFSKRKLGLSPLMIVLAFAWLGINSMRNEPLFAIVAVPLIASLFVDWDLSVLFDGKTNVAAPWFNFIARKWQGIGATVDEVESSCNMHILPAIVAVVLVLACLSGGKFLGMELVTSDFDPKNKPSKTLDAMMQLPEKGGLNLDNWGGYITFKTGRRVFIDDRLDFYGPDFYMDYGRLINTAGDWQGLLSKYKINWILMPKESILVTALKNNPEWESRATDETAELLVRKRPL